MNATRGVDAMSAIEEIRKALEPFAKAAALYDRKWSEAGQPVWDLDEAKPYSTPLRVGDLRRAREALSLLSKLDGWQPPAGWVDDWREIESAPKDGTLFIGWQWSEERKAGSFCFVEWSERAGCFIDDFGDVAELLTHWRLLPAPPKAPGPPK